MLKILIKKQFAEVFKAYFYNRKTNKPRSKANIILMFAFFGFLMIGVMGGMFTFMALGLCGPLHKAEMGWLYFALMSGIAVVLGAFGSVFNTYSGLYLPKDNDLLLCMPIPVRTVIAARLINVYLLGVMYSAVVLLPTMIVYWIVAGVTALNIIGGIVYFLTVTSAVLILSCALGWVVAKISLKLKNKSIIIVLISLAGFALYYFVYFKAQEWIKELLSNAAVYGAGIKNNAYALYLYGSVGEGNVAAMLIFSAAVAALLWLTLFVLSRSFLRIATATGSVKKVRYTEKTAKQRSTFGALLGKEFSRFVSSPNYMLNCGMGVLFIPAVGVFLLIMGGDFLRSINIVLQNDQSFAEMMLCSALLIAASSVSTAAPSVSLEGKNIWIPQSLPVEPKTALFAKTAVQLILTEIPMLFTSVCAVIAVRAPIGDRLMICVSALIFGVFSALFGTFAGIRFPMLEWTSDMIPIKQSGAILLAVFGSWGIAALAAAPYFLIGYRIGLAAYLAIMSGVFAGVSLWLFHWLKTKGAALFAAL